MMNFYWDLLVTCVWEGRACSLSRSYVDLMDKYVCHLMSCNTYFSLINLKLLKYLLPVTLLSCLLSRLAERCKKF